MTGNVKVTKIFTYDITSAPAFFDAKITILKTEKTRKEKIVSIKKKVEEIETRESTN